MDSCNDCSVECCLSGVPMLESVEQSRSHDQDTATTTIVSSPPVTACPLSTLLHVHTIYTIYTLSTAHISPHPVSRASAPVPRVSQSRHPSRHRDAVVTCHEPRHAGGCSIQYSLSPAWCRAGARSQHSLTYNSSREILLHKICVERTMKLW